MTYKDLEQNPGYSQALEDYDIIDSIRDNLINSVEYCEQNIATDVISIAFRRDLIYIVNLLLSAVNKTIYFTHHAPTQSEGNIWFTSNRYSRGILDHPVCFNTECKDSTDPRYTKEYNNYFINLTHIRYDIKNFFESELPTVNPTRLSDLSETGDRSIFYWEEDKALSLALKITPKHRIRAYTCKSDYLRNWTSTAHIDAVPTRTLIHNTVLNIYSNKSFQDDENDYEVLRKCIVAIPYFLNLDPEHTVSKLLREIETVPAQQWITDVTNYLKELQIVKDHKDIVIKRAYNDFIKQRKDNLYRKVNNAREMMNDALVNYTREAERYNDAIAIYNAIADPSLSLDDFRMLTKNTISELKFQEDSCTLAVHSILNDFDSEAAEKILARNINTNRYTTDDLIYKTLKALLIDQTIVLHIKEYINVDLNNGHCNAHGTGNIAGLTLGFPNPHHFHYNCWGNYGPAIVDCAISGDLLALCLQLKTAVGSINVCDSPVFDQFTYDIRRYLDGGCCYNAFALATEPDKLITVYELKDFLNPEEELLDETN